MFIVLCQKKKKITNHSCTLLIIFWIKAAYCCPECPTVYCTVQFYVHSFESQKAWGGFCNDHKSTRKPGIFFHTYSLYFFWGWTKQKPNSLILHLTLHFLCNSIFPVYTKQVLSLRLEAITNTEKKYLNFTVISSPLEGSS